MTIAPTLHRQPENLLCPIDLDRRDRHSRGGGASNRSVNRQKLRCSDAMDAAEERLLAEFLDHHHRQGAALDAILDDLDHLSSELRQSRRAPLLLRSASSLHRVETMLLDAIVRHHPHRERAFDRLMNDISDEDDQPARDEFDMHVDNDYDGMA